MKRHRRSFLSGWLQRLAILGLAAVAGQVYVYQETILDWFNAGSTAPVERSPTPVQLVQLVQPQPGEIVGRASIIDGDTLEIGGQRIRIHGIDAFESDQLCQKAGQSYRCGQVGANALDGLINRRTVRCQGRERDQFGRIVAKCFVESTDVGRWMVLQGHALAFTRYSQDYVAVEREARAAKVGVWAGTFVEPWAYRASKR